MSVESLIDGIIAVEGGYSNDPNDAGGETNYGITIRQARAHGYMGEMSAFPIQMARDIYRTVYWIAPNFFQVADLSIRIAEELLDTGVNMGVGTAVRMLQRSLNVLNGMGSSFPDIQVDDHIGPGTLAALDSYLTQRGTQGEAVMLKALNALQCTRYIELAEARPANESFVYGWIANRIS